MFVKALLKIWIRNFMMKTSGSGGAGGGGVGGQGVLAKVKEG